MDKNPSGELTPIGELLRKAWEIFRGRMWTLMGVGLAAVLLPAVALVPLFTLVFFASQSGSGSQPLVMVATFVLGTVGAMWLGNWGVSAFLTAIVDQQCGIKEAFVKAKPKVLAHIWLGGVTGLIVMGGYCLLFVPGIIFAVWFIFAPFVFLEEDVRGMDALLKSKAYVSGKWIPVCVRLIAIWLVSVLVSFIPVVGQLLAFFLIPFCFVYTFLVYQDLKASKGSMTFQPSKQEKMRFVAVSAFGLVLPVVFFFAFMGSMFLMPFSMLKAKGTGQSPNPLAIEQAMKGPRFSVTPAGPGAAGNVDEDIRTLGDTGADWTKRSQAAFRLGQSQNKKAVAPAKTKIEAKKNKSADPSVQVATGLSGKESKKFRDLIQSCDKALRIQPNDSLTYHNRAAAHFRLGQYPEAIKDFTEALKHNDKDATAYYNRAIAYGMVGDHEKAIEDGLKAIELNPEDASAYANRGVDYIVVGRFDEAVADFDQAIKLNAGDASLYYARGVAYHKLGSQEKALKDFKNAAKKGYQKAREYLKARNPATKRS